jgi:DNA-directed RNA polymerase specialized sigma24 family protein
VTDLRCISEGAKMEHFDSVSLWISQLKQGDQSAAQRLWERYVDQLVRLARKEMGHMSRRVVDEDDLANSAFSGAVLGIQAGRFPQMNDRNDLWQVLVVLTERKSIDLRRRELAAKRGGGAVRGDSVFAAKDPGDSSVAGFSHVIDTAPTPAFAAQAAEELQRLLKLLNDDLLRRVAVAKMEGYTNPEIAQKLEIGLSSVERKLRLIRQTWQDETAG